MSKAYLVSGGSAEYHLAIKTLPELDPLLTYPKRPQNHSLSDDTILERLEVAILSNTQRICVIFDAENKTANQRWEPIRMLLSRNG